jgi:hypothetical protein
MPVSTHVGAVGGEVGRLAVQAGEAEALELALGVVDAVDEAPASCWPGVRRAVFTLARPMRVHHLPLVHVEHGAGVGRGRHGVEQQVVRDQLVALPAGVFVARPVGDLAHPQPGLQVAQRDRHRGLVHDGAADQRAGAALGRQRQLPLGAAVGFLLEVEHGHAEVAVVVGVARVAVVQEHEGGGSGAVVDVGRVDLAR